MSTVKKIKLSINTWLILQKKFCRTFKKFISFLLVFKGTIKKKGLLPAGFVTAASQFPLTFNLEFNKTSDCSVISSVRTVM